MFGDVLFYVHMYVDVNTTMRYVIELKKAVWMSVHYDVMLLCFHVGFLLSKMIIVNTTSS